MLFAVADIQPTYLSSTDITILKSGALWFYVDINYLILS